jgi:transcriptional regulator with XRE-family HTH domain
MKTITKTHWTARSIRDYLFRIAADFIAQLENKMDSIPISQDELADRLGVTKGRVSQWINHPGNISLAKMIEYAKAVGMKVSVVAYEDDDPENEKGPVDAEIFRMCWEQLGKPRDFWAIQSIVTTNRIFANVSFGRRAEDVIKVFEDFKMSKERKGTSSNIPGCSPFIAIKDFEGNKTTKGNTPS